MPAVSSFRVLTGPAESGRAVWRRVDAWMRNSGGEGRWKWVKPIVGWWSILKPVFYLGLGLKK